VHRLLKNNTHDNVINSFEKKQKCMMFLAEKWNSLQNITDGKNKALFVEDKGIKATN